MAMPSSPDIWPLQQSRRGQAAAHDNSGGSGWLAVGLLIAALSFCLTLPTKAAPMPEERARVLSIASTIERDAKSTTYDDLGKYGQQALALKGADKFVRLQYVSQEYIENYDIEKFQKWNQILLNTAKQENSERFIKIAEIDQTLIQVILGDESALKRLADRSTTETDWYVKAHALLQRANISSAMNRNTDSLLLVSEAETLVRGRGIEASYVRLEIDEARALRLITVFDIFGAAKLMEDAASIYHGLGLPRPNNQELYNMAAIAIRLGDEDLANKLFSIYDGLARPSDSQSQKLNYVNLCAAVKQAFGTPQQVLDCIGSTNLDFQQGGPTATIVTVQRALARAQLGQVAQAENDYATLKAIEAKGGLLPTVATRLPVLEAEIKAARGDAQSGFKQLRAYMRSQSITEAQMYDSSRREITEEYTRNLRLRAQLVKSQSLIIALTLAALAGGGVMLGLQIRLANRYRKQRARAEAATAAKDEFLSNMSHEIRTPLTAVIGFAQLLKNRSDLPEDALVQIRKVMDGGNALLLIVNDVLDFSKIESGRLELEPQPFKPKDVVSRAVALVEGLADAKGLNLSFQSDDSLPDLVVGDAGRLRQAILNLVNNAVKFTSSGSVLVKLAYDAQTSRLSCDVTDTGPGIPLDKQALLFKRFSQVDNSVSRVYGGSGLGLAITRSLVELMGGEVSLVSQEGQGSTFSFYVVAPIASELATSEVAAESSAQWDQGQGGQILIVDDREENREILRLMITAVGLTPVLASSGDEGVALANKDPYSLILMDVRMPGLSGLEASRMIRQSSKQNARTPILAITANVSPNEIEECRQAGMQDHVSKPIRAAELLQKVSTWIDTEIESQSPSPATDVRDQKAMA